MKQNDRFVVVVKVDVDGDRRPRPASSTGCRPASRSRTRTSSTAATIKALDWLKIDGASPSTPSSATTASSPRSTSPMCRADREQRRPANANDSDGDAAAPAERTPAASATVAYIVRAVTPGTFVHPAATVEDMYRPERYARTAAGTLTVTAERVSERAMRRLRAQTRMLPSPSRGGPSRRGRHEPSASAPAALRASGDVALLWMAARRARGAVVLLVSAAALAALYVGRRPRSASTDLPRASQASRSPCSTATTGCCAPSRRPTAAGGCRSRPKDVDPRYLAMLMAFEDKRFYRHHGVDPYARRSRAQPGSWSATRRIVSGGSTLTMQVARLLEGKHERTRRRQAAPDRARAAARARICRRTRSCALYLRLAPFGGNLEGVRAASLAYFGKEPRRLSLGEAALLVALPQSPEAAPPRPQSRGRTRAPATACSPAPSRPASSPTAEATRAKAERMPDDAPRFPDARPASRRSRGRRGSRPRLVHRLTSTATCRRALETARRASRRKLARAEAVGRHHRRRSHDRRGHRARRLGRLPRRCRASAPST